MSKYNIKDVECPECLNLGCLSELDVNKITVEDYMFGQNLRRKQIVCSECSYLEEFEIPEFDALNG